MRGHSSSALVLTVILLITLPNCIQASFLGTLLFRKDTLEPVRNAIQQTEQLRREVYGWYEHNATQQANFTVTPDPADVYKLLPADYSGRSLVAPDGSYYKDVEGYYKGEWSGWDFSTQANRSLATDSKLSHALAGKAPKGSDEPKYVEGVDPEKLRLDRGSFNWLTTELSHVDVHLREEHLLPGNVSFITGSLSFNQPKGSRSEEDSVDFSLEGLHFLPTGSLFLHALADETPHSTDVRTSLSLIPEGNNETTNATISAINKAFQLRIDMLQRIIDSGSYDGDDSPSVSPALKHNCSLHVYGQFSSAGPFAEVQPQIDALESEAKHSTGISTIPRPQLCLSLTAFSPECQVVLATHREALLTGLLQIRIWKKAVNYAIIYFLVLLLQTYLLVQQMEATATPSGLLKVSDKTFLAQSVLDAYGCLIHLSVAVALKNETEKPLLACAFVSGVCFLGFGYRYTITVYRAQADAGPSPPTAAEPAAGEGENTIFNATLNAITPTTNNNTATSNAETTAEADRARRRGRVIFATGLFLFMVGFFPIFTITLLLPVLYSFWIPQIYRNVMRGTRKAILKRCVVGITLTRLLVPMYFLLCPDNVLMSETSRWGWVLAGWLGLQAFVLAGQDLSGPHWFLRQSWVPQGAEVGVWEYHPPLSGAEEDGEEGRVYGDCPICLNPIEKRQKKQRRPAAKSKSWFGFSGSNRGYDRLEQAEEFDLPYSVDKSCSRHQPPSGRENRTTGVSGRVKHHLAKTVDQMLAWKESLGAANEAIRGKRMDVMIAPCSHAFHTKCLERWLGIKGECPSCRSALPSV
ncbi:hypothetical protein NDA13_004856 [Ustilago tritici]|nr:hypothetical protein NDA13_004856 [Ustilago tritici]